MANRPADCAESWQRCPKGMLPPDRIHSLICQVCTELDERCREEILFASRCGIEYALAAPGRKDARYGVAVKTGLMQKNRSASAGVDRMPEAVRCFPSGGSINRERTMSRLENCPPRQESFSSSRCGTEGVRNYARLGVGACISPRPCLRRGAAGYSGMREARFGAAVLSA